MVSLCLTAFPTITTQTAISCHKMDFYRAQIVPDTESTNKDSMCLGAPKSTNNSSYCATRDAFAKAITSGDFFLLESLLSSSSVLPKESVPQIVIESEECMDIALDIDLGRPLTPLPQPDATEAPWDMLMLGVPQPHASSIRSSTRQRAMPVRSLVL